VSFKALESGLIKEGNRQGEGGLYARGGRVLKGGGQKRTCNHHPRKMKKELNPFRGARVTKKKKMKRMTKKKKCLARLQFAPPGSRTTFFVWGWAEEMVELGAEASKRKKKTVRVKKKQLGTMGENGCSKVEQLARTKGEESWKSTLWEGSKEEMGEKKLLKKGSDIQKTCCEKIAIGGEREP